MPFQEMPSPNEQEMDSPTFEMEDLQVSESYTPNINDSGELDIMYHLGISKSK